MCPVNLGFRTPLGPTIIWRYMPVSKFDTALSAALTLATVYAPLTDRSACTMISASAKPIWLKLPTPPETALPYLARIALYSRIAGVLSLKTLLYQIDFDAGKTAGDYVKPALYLNEEMRLEEALRRMQRGGQRLGIVLGRDQRELGIISLQDVLKFVFGELSL